LNDDEIAKHKQVDCKDKNKFKCACGVVYGHQESLNNHIKYKTISYTCPHCSKVYVSSTAFKNHMNDLVCVRGISDDDDDDDSFESEHSSKSSLHGSSRKSSRTPPASSNARG
jgi:hypothetical protein